MEAKHRMSGLRREVYLRGMSQGVWGGWRVMGGGCTPEHGGKSLLPRSRLCRESKRKRAGGCENILQEVKLTSSA